MTDIAARNKANRGKGKRWEREIRDGFRLVGLDVENLRDTGAKDEGDLVVRDMIDGVMHYTVVEAKNATFTPGPFVDEAELEALHFGQHRNLSPSRITPVAIIKRRGHGFRKAFVLTTVESFFDLPPS